MRRKVKRIQDEEAIKFAREYLETIATIKELQSKYGFKGDGGIYTWIRKFGLSKPTGEEVQIMNKVKSMKKIGNTEARLIKEVEAL